VPAGAAACRHPCDVPEVIDSQAGLDASSAGGHGGGDAALVDAFLTAVVDGDRAAILTDARTSLRSHQVVRAAERARESLTVIELPAAAHP
jgi:hypothetical protein